MDSNIVQTSINYTSSILYLDISKLKLAYPFIEVASIGKSVLEKDIPYIKIGEGQNEVFYSGAIHANEWIVAPLLMKFVENYLLAIMNNSNIYGYNARELFKYTSLYIVPMCNPDGVDLVTGATSSGRAYNQAKNISKKYPSILFPSGWKANIKGVDLNLQFPAGWQEAKKIKYNQGFTLPAPRDFVGEGPLTEPESLALYNFTLNHSFRLIISYHTQGQEIYWQFQDYAPKEAKEFGNIFSAVSGYTLTNPEFNSSFAGYKDWFLQEYRKPGYTIEAGLGQNPLPINQFNEIYNNNLGILVLSMVL